MKQVNQKSPIPASRAFVVKSLVESHFDPTWHAHDEYQIFLALKGTGTRFIGNTVKAFKEGDLTFLGPQVPHLWRSDAAFFKKNSKLEAHGLVVYFKEDFLHGILAKEEMLQIKKLFKLAQQGIDYHLSMVPLAQQFMEKMLEARGAENIILFLQLLNSLAQTKRFDLLHNEGYTYTLKESATRRINLVYNYTAQHFKDAITLEEIAKLLNMTPTSFSRYFKIKTSKSFSDFLAELRIKQACKLLAENDQMSIQQIGFECGYNTLSNFNRQFKYIMHMTPKEYRQQFDSL